jgi:DNA helicase-2/ATP-dependent DNA helicase PcrA
MGKFNESYSRLNTAQKLAVDAIEGPVLVLAGPGTGKTQLLSARVANILQNTDTDPSTITCLTFTVNAANNMRERLRGMIGSTANQVVIKTFHSLAADIISSNPQHFYAGATLNPVSELAAQEILQSIFDTLSHDNPLAVRYDNRYSYLGSALNAISKAKDAGLTPDKLKLVLDQNKKNIDLIEPQLVEILATSLSHKTLPDLSSALESLLDKNPDNPLAVSIGKLFLTAIEHDLPTTKSAATSKLKSKLLKNDGGVKKLVTERRATAWWSSLVKVYESYQLALYKRGYLDYSDMLISVIDTLQNNEDLRLDIQENTHYLLIDEFQDSNHAQITLAHLLTDNPAIQNPNIMVVGDPNQTIYGFNGAVLDNIDRFQQFYGDAITTVNLVENYRSTQTILDNAKHIIDPYSSYQPVLSANIPDGESVQYNAYATPNDQAIAVGDFARKILSKHPDQSVAILGRGHASLSFIARYLHEKQVPVNYEQVIDLRTTKSNTLILNIVRLLQAMTRGDKQTCNNQLSILLQHNVFNIDATTLWKIATSSHKTRDWLMTAHKEPATKPIIDWLQTLVRISASEPINSVIEQILSSQFGEDKTLLSQLFVSDDPEITIVEAQSTSKLIEIAKQYSQLERIGIDELVALTDSDTQTRLFSFSPNVGRHSQAVNLMSVHAAKGLEFDHVLIVDGDDKNWKPSSNRYPIPVSLDIHVGLETAADYARLLYVAMTRAKRTLSVSYVHGMEGETKRLPAEQLTGIKFNPVKPASNEDFAQTAVSEVLFPRPLPKTMHELLETQLTNFKLSPTALTSFLDLNRGGPAHFIEHNLLKLPEPASTTLIHGNAMHSAMELAQIQVNNNRQDLDAIKRLYAKKVHAEGLPNQATDRLVSKGEAQLDTLFNEFSLSLETTSMSEQGLSIILQDNTPLYGKIDRLDVIDDKTLRVVDYKTGNPLLTMNSKSEQNRIKMWRHNLQLGFYMLLLTYTKRYSNKKYLAQIIQLDAGSQDHLFLDYQIDESELVRIEKLATAVYKHIVALDMPDISSYGDNFEGIRAFEQDLIDGKI